MDDMREIPLAQQLSLIHVKVAYFRRHAEAMPYFASPGPSSKRLKEYATTVSGTSDASAETIQLLNSSEKFMFSFG
jgi:hypothetical protein